MSVTQRASFEEPNVTRRKLFPIARIRGQNIDRLRIKGVISEIARTNLDLQEFSDREVNYETSSFCYH